MDTIKIGEFLTQLRKEKNLTQAQLGEKIGVTNKTISRWENGNYMPSVDMLKLLSEEFGVTINEIINGERIAKENYKEVTDENLIEVLKHCSFTQKEKMSYWKKRWIKNHLASLIFFIILYISLLTYGIIKGNIYVISVATVCGFIIRTVRYNRMMAYIEKNAF